MKNELRLSSVRLVGNTEVMNGNFRVAGNSVTFVVAVLATAQALFEGGGFRLPFVRRVTEGRDGVGELSRIA